MIGKLWHFLRTYALSIWIVVFSCTTGWVLWHERQQDNRDKAFALQELEEEEVEDAIRCIDAWSRSEQIRDQAEASYRRNAQTLIEIAQGATPDEVAAYEAAVERDVVQIRAFLDDPICDLEAAERLVGSSQVQTPKEPTQ